MNKAPKMEKITEPCQSCGANDSPENEVTLGLDPHFGPHRDGIFIWLCDQCFDKVEVAIKEGK